MSGDHTPLPIFDFGDDAGGIPELSDRDTACLVLPDLNYDNQLQAIRHLIRTHRKMERDERAAFAEVKRIVETAKGMRAEHAESELAELFYDGVYSAAARSTAAIGMLAPIAESLFDQAFAGIRQTAGDRAISMPPHPRWSMNADQAWDCHLMPPAPGEEPPKDVVRGIGQLSEAVGLAPFLPSDLSMTLTALFGYRNKMLHCGFEWRQRDRDRFSRTIATAGWPQGWFSQATSDGRPWVFYMTDAFIDHSVATIDRVLEGIGKYCKAVFIRRGP
ncbi:MAG: hypothetical protein QM783_16085 [Phycisphaerales bacterium]